MTTVATEQKQQDPKARATKSPQAALKPDAAMLHNETLPSGQGGLVFRVEKAFGREEWFCNTRSYCGKRLVLEAGKMVSVHKHRRKAEHLVICDEGVWLAIWTNGLEKEPTFVAARQGEVFFVRPGTWHAIYAAPSGKKTREIIETSTTHREDDSDRLDAPFRSGECASLSEFIRRCEGATRGAGPKGST